MSYGKITIILPTKNHENEIVENILSLESFLVTKYLEYQILIMSNGSSIDNKKLLERIKDDNGYTEIHYLDKTGKGNAIKEGISLSKYNHILIFDYY